MRPFQAFACGNQLADVLGAGAGISTGQRPPAGTYQIRCRGRLGRNAETTLHVHRHGRGLRRFLRHEHERRGRQLRPLVGLVIQEPGRAPRQIAAALHGDRDVGQRMGDALQCRDRHAQCVAGLGELGRDRHGLLHQPHQCRRRSAPAIHPVPVGIPLTRRIRWPARCGCRRPPDPPRPSAVGRCCPPWSGACRRSSRTTSSPSRTMI